MWRSYLYNKKEAEQYFEENLTIEIKIIDQNNKRYRLS